jgi:Tat protein secretion system quality control protein TatD with DNase activity
MSDLLKAQFQFRSMFALLLQEAARLNLPIKIHCVRCESDHHSKNSLHKDGLAVDLPMVMHDGSMGTWNDYFALGRYWESIGGCWGGRFDLNNDGVAKDDANHFSLAYGGRR